MKCQSELPESLKDAQRAESMSVGVIRHLSICSDSETCSQSFDSVTNLKRGNMPDPGKPGIWIRDGAHKTRHSSDTVRSANPQGIRRREEDERVYRQIFPGRRQGFPKLDARR